MFLNSFCASATPTTHTSTVTDTQTVTITQNVTSISTLTERETVTSVSTTTDTSIMITTEQIQVTTTVSTAIITVSPKCTTHKINNNAQLCPGTTITTYLPSVQSSQKITVSRP